MQCVQHRRGAAGRSVGEAREGRGSPRAAAASGHSQDLSTHLPLCLKNEGSPPLGFLPARAPMAPSIVVTSTAQSSCSGRRRLCPPQSLCRGRGGVGVVPALGGATWEVEKPGPPATRAPPWLLGTLGPGLALPAVRSGAPRVPDPQGLGGVRGCTQCTGSLIQQLLHTSLEGSYHSWEGAPPRSWVLIITGQWEWE